MESNFVNNKKIFYDAILDIVNEYENKKKPKPEFPKVAFNLASSIEIINKVSSILKDEPAILQINTKENEFDFVIVGDIHGSLSSLIKIFKERGYPPTTRYLFLGDYVDRGHKSCEVMILLYSLKCLFPNDVYLIRGNHEFKNMTDHYSSYAFYKSVTDTFPLLPIGAILDDSIFCVHGGVTSYVKNREELLSLNKVGSQYYDDDLAQAEMLWNDPSKLTNTYTVSKRGRGSVFGERAVDTFLQNMNFKLIIRGHQNVFNGFDWPFGRKGGILTVFSAIDYCQSANNGGIAVILKENDIENNKLVNVHQIDNYPSCNGLYHSFSCPSFVCESF